MKSSLLVIALIISMNSLGQKVLYISPDGLDEAPGTFEQPVSLFAAKKLVRELKSITGEEIQVLLRGGTYHLHRTLVFRPEDGGSGNQKISWQAYPGESPVLSSGVQVTKWGKLKRSPPGLPESARGKVWVADLPEGKGLFRAMFKEEEMLPRARGQGFLPTIDAFNRDGKGHLRSRTELHYPEGAMIRNWENLDDIEIAIRPFALWVFNILPLKSVDEKNRVATTKVEGTYFLTRERYNRFGDESVWVENILEGMNQPGNWCVNTVEGRIYYWPAEGEEPSEVYRPTLCEYIRIEGINTEELDGDVPVRNLSIRGLTFIHGDRDVWMEGDRSVQHDWELVDKANAYIRLRGAENCTIEECELRNGANAGIRLDLYAQHNTIYNNCIHHLGGSGIVLCGYGPGFKDVNKGNIVDNNCLHDLGKILYHNSAILVNQSGENRISHNLIFNMPYNGMAICGFRSYFFNEEFRKAWKRGTIDGINFSFTDSTTNAVAVSLREIISTIRWDEVGELHESYSGKGEVGRNRFFDLLLPFIHCRGNIIEYNEIHHVMQVLGDGNAVYISDTGPFNIIRRNYIHDMMDVFGVAIRTDAYQRETVVSGNIIYRCAGGLAISNNNQAFHNVLVNLGGPEFAETAEKYSFHGNVYWDMSRAGGFNDGIIQRNVVYNTGSEPPNFSFHPGAKADDRQLIDYNLFWWVDNSHALYEQLEDHKKAGYDFHSRIGDPLFIDLKNEDFRFHTESPAHLQGIPSLDRKQMGLTKKFPERFRILP